MKAGIIALIVAILVIAGGAVLVLKKDKKDSTATTQPATTQNTAATAANGNTSTANGTSQNATDSTVATITYSDSGFSPGIITVKSGSTVTIKNTSSHSMQFDSDPHPVHTANKELNVDNIGAGQTKTFTVSKTGTFGYHNHLNPSETGTIVVE